MYLDGKGVTCERPQAHTVSFPLRKHVEDRRNVIQRNLHQNFEETEYLCHVPLIALSVRLATKELVAVT